MKVFLGGLSALEYWTRVRLGTAAQPRLSRITSLRSCAHRESDLRALAEEPALRGLTRPLDVLIDPGFSNKGSDVATRHRMSIAPPPKSFFIANDSVAVCSPELSFLQLSRHLTPLESILLACELCGDYALLLNDNDCLVQCKPLTSRRNLEQYLSLCQEAKGIKQARRAASCAFDKARSPMESKVALLLSESNARGGFGLAKPELNLEMSILSINGERQVRACDLLWRDKQLAIEYDSSTHHEGHADIDRDARRRNQLVLNGLTVLTVTRRQVKEFAYMEGLAQEVRELLGVTQRCRVPNVRMRRQALHRSLFSRSDSPLRRLHDARTGQ